MQKAGIFDEPDAIHNWHFNIGYDHIEFFTSQDIQSLLPIGGLPANKSPVAKHCA